MRILVAYDGSDASRAAIEDLALAGLPREADALVLAVGEVWLPAPTSYGLVDTDTVARSVVIHEAGELAREGVGLVAAAHPGWRVEGESHAGSPARAVLDRAGDWKPDVVAVGSHGRTGLARFFLGSVSQKVAVEAHCSVRIGRHRDRVAGPPRVLVAVDGSLGGDAAVEAAAEREWPAGTLARVVTAVGPLPIDGAGVRAELERVREFQERAAARLRGAGLETTTLIREDDPRHFVVEAAREWSADSVFIGATGFVSLERALFGTVVAAVAARAACTVEVIRPRY